MNLSSEIVNELARILDARVESLGNETVLHCGEQGKARVVLTLAPLSDARLVVSAQTIHGYFELHHVDRYVPVEPGEVIFVAEQDDRISGLVVGQEGTCSLFANVTRAALSADFATLEPPLLLAAMQLGLTEVIPE